MPDLSGKPKIPSADKIVSGFQTMAITVVRNPDKYPLQLVQDSASIALLVRNPAGKGPEQSALINDLADIVRCQQALEATRAEALDWIIKWSKANQQFAAVASLSADHRVPAGGIRKLRMLLGSMEDEGFRRAGEFAYPRPMQLLEPDSELPYFAARDSDDLLQAITLNEQIVEFASNPFVPAWPRIEAVRKMVLWDRAIGNFTELLEAARDPNIVEGGRWLAGRECARLSIALLWDDERNLRESEMVIRREAKLKSAGSAYEAAAASAVQELIAYQTFVGRIFGHLNPYWVNAHKAIPFPRPLEICSDPSYDERTRTYAGVLLVRWRANLGMVEQLESISENEAIPARVRALARGSLDKAARTIIASRDSERMLSVVRCRSISEDLRVPVFQGILAGFVERMNYVRLVELSKDEGLSRPERRDVERAVRDAIKKSIEYSLSERNPAPLLQLMRCTGIPNTLRIQAGWSAVDMLTENWSLKGLIRLIVPAAAHDTPPEVRKCAESKINTAARAVAEVSLSYKLEPACRELAANPDSQVHLRLLRTGIADLLLITRLRHFVSQDVRNRSECAIVDALASFSSAGSPVIVSAELDWANALQAQRWIQNVLFSQSEKALSALNRNPTDAPCRERLDRIADAYQVLIRESSKNENAGIRVYLAAIALIERQLEAILPMMKSDSIEPSTALHLDFLSKLALSIAESASASQFHRDRVWKELDSRLCRKLSVAADHKMLSEDTRLRLNTVYARICVMGNGGVGSHHADYMEPVRRGPQPTHFKPVLLTRRG